DCMPRLPPCSPLFPYTTLFRSEVERLHHLRSQLGFHCSEREVCLVFLVVVFLDTAFAADIGYVVLVVRAGATRRARLLRLRLGISIDALDSRRLLGFRPGISCLKVDDLTQQNLAFVELVAPNDDGLEGERRFAKARDHRLAASFDALCNGDL